MMRDDVGRDGAEIFTNGQPRAFTVISSHDYMRNRARDSDEASIHPDRQHTFVTDDAMPSGVDPKDGGLAPANDHHGCGGFEHELIAARLRSELSVLALRVSDLERSNLEHRAELEQRDRELDLAVRDLIHLQRRARDRDLTSARRIAVLQALLAQLGRASEQDDASA